MKLAVLKESGVPRAFYDPEFQTAPEGAVEISEAQWQEFLSHPGARRWHGGEVVAYEAPTPPPTTEQRLAYAAQKRWQIETGGFTWNGHLVATDRDSRAIIHQERSAIVEGIRADPDGFKMGGELVMIGNDDFIAMSNAIREFVRACFAVEAQIAAAILAGTIASFAEIDAAAWPANAPAEES